MASSPKIIVFDDDPTGSQTVRGCPLLLDFSTASLQAGLADPSPLLFLLTNSRALEPEQVRQQLTALCQRLKPLLEELQRPWLVVSRGDSTLRGHTPLELEVIRSELGPFAANLLVPAFPQGGAPPQQACTCCMGSRCITRRLPAIGALAIPAAICPNGLSTKQLERSRLLPLRG